MMIIKEQNTLPFKGSADAYTYDTILQYALFDEIVYG